VSTDDEEFTEVASGTWSGDVSLKVATFDPIPARYVRLEALSAMNHFAAATEIAIGRADTTYVPGDISNTSERIATQSQIYSYPNPAKESTNFVYQVSDYGLVTIDIYDYLGRKVISSREGYQPAGSYTTNLYTCKLSEGYYLFEIQLNRIPTGRHKLLISH
jgi:hypothetical protein